MRQKPADHLASASGRPRVIPKPEFPNRAGVAAIGTARLVIVAMFCIFQYWLLTATLEAYHAGDRNIPLGAFLASLACFLLAAGLVAVGEYAEIRQQQFLRESRTGHVAESSIAAEQITPASTLGGPTPADRVTSSSRAAGGGDAG